MDFLFNLAINKFTLFFNSEELEAKYRMSLGNYGRAQEIIGIILIFIATIVEIGFQSYELYLCIKAQPNRFILEVELFIIIGFCSSLILELVCFCFDKLRYFRGCFFILNPLLAGGEASARYTGYCFAVTCPTVTCAVASIYVGIAYNRFWINSSISYFIAIVYLVIRMLQYSTILVFQKIILITWMTLLLAFVILIFYYNDIVLRKNFFSYELLQRKQQFIKDVLNFVPVSIMVKTEENIGFLNGTLKKLLGISQLEEKDIKALKKLERKARYKEYLNKIKSDDDNELVKVITEKSIEELKNVKFYLKINEDKFEFKVSGVEFTSFEKKITAYVIEDISQILRIQKETEKKYQKILIASFSHDLFTPINGCLGFIDILLNKITDSKIVKKIIIIKNSIIKLSYFVYSLKFYTLIESNSLRNDTIKINIIQVIREICEIFKRDIMKKGLELILNFDSPVIILKSDFRLVSQIIFTLIENAVKHTFKGSLCIEVKKSQEYFQLIVQDSGEGIKEQLIERIFDIYGCSEKSNELNPQGIGLSLYVCKKISRFLSADLIVNSIITKGTVFEFKLPLSNNIEEEKSKSFFPKNVGRKELRQSIISDNEIREGELGQSSSRSLIFRAASSCNCKKYLVVDDDTTNISVLQSYFKSINTKCDIAYNGEIAVNLVKANNNKKCCKGYKFIIMDINMPIMDGEEATRIIKRMAKDNEINDSIIIGLTAAQIQDETQREKFIQAGFEDIYNKPLARKQFIKLCDRYG